MKRLYALSFVFCLFFYAAPAQQTIGLFSNTPQAFDGYTLFAPMKNTTTYLINNCGEKVHSWSTQSRPNASCYLLEDGTLLRTGIVPGGGGTGIIEMRDWNGHVIWDYTVPAAYGESHHDVAALPNGNILLVVTDERTQAEVLQAGSTTTNASIKSEQVIEVQPDLVNGGGTIVWNWKAWDHLIQDADAGKANYGVVSQHPEKIDINFLNHNTADWLHINAIEYNAQLDQVMVSVRNFSELWVIDHSTSTAQAAGSTGGTYGKGGDLLYRWGNPQAYSQGTAADQQLFHQHNTQWIPATLAGGGKILVFNNEAGTPTAQNYSTVHVIAPPVDVNGAYTYSGGAYGPAAFDWTYKAATATDFFSNIVSGAQRLENGNTLICEGVKGRFFEVDDQGTVVWQYINPVNDLGPQAQGSAITDNITFRCTRYAPDYPGLAGKTLTPQGYIESGSTFSCTLYPTGINDTKYAAKDITLYPNPASDRIKITFPGSNCTVHIYNTIGQMVKTTRLGAATQEIDISALSSGVYQVVISGSDMHVTRKLVVE